MRGQTYTKNCLKCGAFFTFPASRSKQKNDFCSTSCYHETRLTAEQQFWKFVTPSPDSCWIWQGQKNRKGYGVIDTRETGVRKILPAHRVSFSIHGGHLPEGFIIRHKCDTPACVNPSHLEPGTSLQNSHDMVSRGRQTKCDKHPHAKLTSECVRQIKEMRDSGIIMRVIAEHFNVHRITVADILSGRTWKTLKD